VVTGIHEVVLVIVDGDIIHGATEPVVNMTEEIGAVVTNPPEDLIEAHFLIIV